MMKLLITLVVMYAVIAAGMALGQRKLMYYPLRDLQAPEHYGLSGVEAGSVTSRDNETLAYWYLPPRNAQPVVLYFHGNGGHLGHRAHFFAAAAERGYGVFMLSYRGYGTSTGSPHEQGLCADAEAAYDFVRTQLQVPAENLVIFGESLGTGVAVQLARGKQFKALVLQAPFTSAAQIASDIYWWLPISLLLKDRFDSLSKVGEVAVPVLVFAAQNDRVVPAHYAKSLFDGFAQPKQFVLVDGIGHNDFAAGEVLDVLGEFTRALPIKH